MKFVNQFRKDVESRQSYNGVIFYMYSNFDTDMIQRIRNHSPMNTLFIFCQSPYTFSNQYNYNRRINQAIIKSGYSTSGIKQYNLDEITDLEVIEKNIRKKYKGANYRPMTHKFFGFRPYLKRYVIKMDDYSERHQDLVLYHVIFDPVAFLEILFSLNEKFENKLRLGLVIREFNNWFGNIKLLQPDKKLMKAINPEFIISPKAFWYSNGKQKSYFRSGDGEYATPIEIDNEFVICHRREFATQKENDLADHRTLIDMGVIYG